MFLEPIATRGWFDTQPRFGLDEDGVEELFGWPSVHAPTAKHLVVTELCYFALQLWGLYYASVRRKQLGVWLGMAVIGAQMEFLGVVITHSHKQSQMLVQLMPFLPLKEVLWYPMTQYPCFVLASQLGLSMWGTAAAAALLHSFQVIQYESMAYRNGVNYLISNPNFLLANTEDLIGGGPWMNIYGNFAICFTACVMAQTRYRFTIMSLCGLLAVSVLGFYPVNVLKLLGCVFGGVSLWPSGDLFDINTWIEVYTKMMKQSPVLENLVVKLILLLSMAFVVNARKQSQVRQSDSLFVVGNLVLYHALLGAVVYTCDEGKEVSSAEALSIWLSCFTASMLLCHYLVTTGNEEEDVTKTKCE